MGANLELLTRWFDEVWCEPRRDAAIDEMMAPACEINGLDPSAPTTRDDFKRIRAHQLANSPDTRVELVEAREVEDGVAYHASVTGHVKETSQAYSFTGTGLVRIRDGKIVASRETWDFASMLAQTGVIDGAMLAREVGGEDIPTHRQVLETWFRRVWTDADESAIDEMFTLDTEAKGLGDQPRAGPEGFKVFHRQFLKMMKDFSVRIDRSMEMGDWIFAMCMLNARRKDDGACVAMPGMVLVRIADGQLVDAYNQWDFLSLYQQLGLVPGDTFERCLGGDKIV